MSTKSKITRKELKSPDEFISVTSRGLDWVAGHRKPILIGLAAVAVTIAGLWAWRHFASRGSFEASSAFSQALEVYRRPLKADKAAGLLDEDDDRKPFDTAKDRAKAALEKFTTVAERYRGAEVGKLAQLYIGSCQYTLGETDKAIAAYEAFLQSKPQDAHLEAIGHENLGYAYERKKEYAKAIASFERMASGRVLAERGLYHVGRLHALQGDKAKAKEWYQKALDKAKADKVDWFAQEIESKIAMLELE